MNIISTDLPDVTLIEPKVFGDVRGFFLETWSSARYQSIGINQTFVQDNLSFSQRGVLRGLHFQHPNEQGKLVYVLQGVVFDVVVDIRRGSPSFGCWIGMELSFENKRQIYIPPGFAHGFCVTSTTALFAYKCTDVYSPIAEGTVAWDDPDLGIRWPVETPHLSAKDRRGMRLRDMPAERLPSYAAEQTKK